ncbi:MAG: hypothetical protein JWO95_1094, partial [Verrucomicrobiales bacterium]|nr:hypothetical protein [Verrucomicrobiales bacterium]
QPSALAVSLQANQSNIGLAIYDNGVPRTQTAPGREYGGVYYLRFSTNTGTLYETIPFNFRRISVTGSGAQMTLENSTLVPDYDNAFETDNGLIYFQAGRVVNPTALTVITNLPIGGVVRPDVANNRLYFVTGAGQFAAVWQLTIHALDATTYNELWAIPLPVGNGYASKLLTIGTNSLALLTDANRLFMVEIGSLAQPQADVSILATSAPTSATVGATNTYTYKIANAGPWTASGVVFTNALPTGTTFISATSSLGTCVLSNGAVVCQLQNINSGASGTVTVKLKVNNTGIVTNTATVSYAYEVNPTNNISTVQTTINASPAPALVSIADAFLLNGNSTSTTMVFTVTLSKVSSSTVTVGYQTFDGTGKAGTDYVAASGVLTFGPGFTSRPLNVSIVPTNIVVSTNRNFYVSLVTFTNVAPGRTTATGTILENHFRTLTVSANDVVRSTNGVTNAVFRFTLSPTDSSPASAQYQTADGTAAAGVDYQAKAGTICFAAGASNATLSVPVFGSQLAQSNQFFSVLLSQPANAVLAANEQQVRIINTVTLPAVAIVSFQLQGTNGLFGFDTIKGRYYRLETAGTIPAPTWTAVTDPVLGSGTFMQVQNPLTLSQPAFYRLVLLP